MSKINFLIISILTVFLAAGTITNAQDKPSEKKDMQTMIQHDDMQKCMDKIAADSTMRMQMMNDKDMMKDGMMKHDMMSDSTKTKNKSDHESHH